MRVDEISLRNFAGFDEERVCFSPGLNLICGPNEAGKSTLMSALEVCLFAPLSYRRGSKEHDDWLSRFFPRDGGDNFRLQLVGRDSKNRICITKHFFRQKERNSGEIQYGGQHIAGQKQMQSKLREILGFGRGTYNSTVLINQGSLDSTVQQLQNREDDSIERTLRSAVFESEGVSVQQFEEVLTERLQAKVNRWDLDSNQPQRPTRYKRNLGTIIDAHYKWQDLGEKLGEIRDREQKAGDLRGEIERKEALRTENEKEADRLIELAEKWQQHEEYQRVHTSYAEAKKAVYNWKSHSDRVQHYEDKLSEYAEKLRRRQTAQKQVQKARKYQQLCQLRDELNGLKDEINECDARLQELPQVTESELQRLQELDLKIQRTCGKLDALQLVGNLKLHDDVECQVIRGLKEETETFTSSADFTAVGQFTLEVPDVLRLHVRSADEELPKLQKQLRDCREQLSERLDSFECDSIEDAREVLRVRKSCEEKKTQLTNNLESRLQARDLDDFCELAGEIDRLSEEENPYLQCSELPTDDELQQQAEDLRTEREEFIRETEPIKSEFEKWQEDFGTFDEAAARQAQLKQRLSQLEDELSEGFDPEVLDWESPQKMREESRRLFTEAQKLTREVQQLYGRLQRIEEYLQENPPEQIERERQRMYQRTEREKRAARALLQVKGCFERVRKKLDAQTFTGLKRGFAEHLELVTDGRYEIGEMRGLQPSGLRRSDEGVQFPLHLLSAGTRDCAALSLRLAIAAEIFSDGESFILMDEPVVNFDTERKRKAAGLIQDFAGDFQVLLFSCDAETAELLGEDANVIEYDRRL